MKQCNKCLITKEFSEFSPNSESRDGYRSTCKICRNKHLSEKSKTINNKPDYIQSEKECSMCGQFKSPQEFYVNKVKPDGLSVRCKPCQKGAIYAQRKNLRQNKQD